MKVGILNSGGYNFNSIKLALNRLMVKSVVLVGRESEFDECDKIIIPGVGHARNAMNLLDEQNLIEKIKHCKKPALGICLGMQIMCNFSEEGGVACLGIFDETVCRLPSNARVPQMGWNQLINGKHNANYVYFANSYYVPVCQHTESFVNYEGVKLSAVIRKDNFVGCQFHPEKSGQVGQRILSDFVSI